LPAVLIHGTKDDIVSIEDSRSLAESNGAPLFEIDDDHRLGSIRESGLLVSALDSLGIYQLMTNKEFFLHPREPRVQWLNAFISPETPLIERVELAKNCQMYGVELRLALMAALRGVWRDPQNESDVKNRMVIWELIQRTGGRRSQRQMAPFGLRVQGRDDQGVLHRGKIGTTYGSSLYDYHYEWPIKGMGVRKDKIKVLHDGVETPIFEWLREKEITVFCYHCGGILSDRSERGCRGRGL